MRAMLLGVRRVDMTDRQTGELIKGYTCHISYPSQGVQGEEVDRRFVSDSLANFCEFVPVVGQMVNIDFTPRGKVSMIAMCNDK